MSEELKPISYPGFMNMVHTLFGGAFDPTPLAGKKLASVTTEEDGNYLRFTFEDGGSVRYMAEGDCCSSSWIEHLTVPRGIKGAEIMQWVEQDMGEFEKDWETIRVYQTSFRTDKGDIIVEYRNSSNGYYGGWLSGPVSE